MAAERGGVEGSDHLGERLHQHHYKLHAKRHKKLYCDSKMNSYRRRGNDTYDSRFTRRVC